MTYTRYIMLENWDENIEMWDPWTMGMWPFGTPLTLEFEVWHMMEKIKDELELMLLGEEEEEGWNFDDSESDGDDDMISHEFCTES